MLYAFGFEKICVVLSDLYFLDPNPSKGQEGAEQGVRLEVRVLERGELKGSVYSAQPIEVDRPLWRADLLESVDQPGSFDRTHHHPRFRGWEPTRREFVTELSADPVQWVGSRLADLDGLLGEAGGDDRVEPTDAEALRRAVPEILGALQRLLDGVRDGELAQPPSDADLTSARVSWL